MLVIAGLGGVVVGALTFALPNIAQRNPFVNARRLGAAIDIVREEPEKILPKVIVIAVADTVGAVRPLTDEHARGDFKADRFQFDVALALPRLQHFDEVACLTPTYASTDLSQLYSATGLDNRQLPPSPVCAVR